MIMDFQIGTRRYGTLERLGVALICWLWILGSCLNAVGEVYRYDASGRLMGVSYEDGQEMAYTYDARGNLTGRTTVSPLDRDRDQMDDEWEERFFGGSDRDGSGDFDQDGQDDLGEFFAQTDPTDPNSVLRFGDVEALASGGILVSWNSVEGVRYRLQSRNDLSGGEWLDIRAMTAGTGGQMSAVDERPAPAEGGRFYRIVVLP